MWNAKGRLAKKRKEKDTEEGKLRGPGIEQDLEEREKVMDQKVIENRGKLAKKRKEREEEEEENKHKKKQKNAHTPARVVEWASVCTWPSEMAGSMLKHPWATAERSRLMECKVWSNP